MANDKVANPNTEQLSIVLATILLGYVLGQFINTPSTTYSIQVLGIYIPFRINFNNLVGLTIAAMTAAGTSWLMENHPYRDQESILPHMILPTMTAWILNILLSNLQISPTWWVYFMVGALFLLIVIWLEYIVFDPEDYRQPFAATGLNALSIAGFLVLVVSLRSTNFRLLFLLPPIFAAGGLVNLRASHLQLKNRWLLPQALTCGIVITQLAAALHYLPVSALQFGVFLLGPLYTFTNLTINLEQRLPIRQALTEPAAALVLIWGVGIGLWF